MDFSPNMTTMSTDNLPNIWMFNGFLVQIRPQCLEIIHLNVQWIFSPYMTTMSVDDLPNIWMFNGFLVQIRPQCLQIIHLNVQWIFSPHTTTMSADDLPNIWMFNGFLVQIWPQCLQIIHLNVQWILVQIWPQCLQMTSQTSASSFSHWTTHSHLLVASRYTHGLFVHCWNERWNERGARVRQLIESIGRCVMMMNGRYANSPSHNIKPTHADTINWFQINYIRCNLSILPTSPTSSFCDRFDQEGPTVMCRFTIQKEEIKLKISNII